MWNNNNASTESREASSVSIISIEVYIDDRLAVVKNSRRITKFKFLFSWYFVPDTPQCLAMFWFLIEVV